jgi:hypothetical protein
MNTFRFVLLALWVHAGWPVLAGPPRHIYVTYAGDPSSSAVIHLHLPPGKTLIPTGSSWRFRDVEAPPPAGWNTWDADDQDWPQGKAPFGYGDDRVATVVSFGADANNKRPVSYYRYTFTRDDEPDQCRELFLSLLRIDGAVIYLNGHEVHRSNMLAGAVGHATMAADEAWSRGALERIVLAPERWRPALRRGRNVIAVQVHRALEDGEALLFDCELRATHERDARAEVRYDTVSRAGDAAAYAGRASAEGRRLPAVDDRQVFAVPLNGLPPGSEIYFVAGSETLGWSAEQRFRTLPASPTRLKFIVGGDNGVGPVVDRVFALAASQNPDFVVLGGDLSYANELPEAFEPVWDRWLSSWCQAMRDREGRLLPLITAVGNHDVRNGFGATPEEAPYFWGMFAVGQGETTFFNRDFGDLLRLIVLDTHHIVHPRDQVEFLRRQLAPRHHRYRIAIYHVPFYPSHAPFDERSALARSFWLPLFDEHRLEYAFEHHDHTLKRTHPLRGGVPTPGGTVYFGDGAMGREPRTTTDRPYLIKHGSDRNFWLVELDGDNFRARAIGIDGTELDTFTSPAPAR